MGRLGLGLGVKRFARQGAKLNGNTPPENALQFENSTEYIQFEESEEYLEFELIEQD